MIAALRIVVARGQLQLCIEDYADIAIAFRIVDDLRHQGRFAGARVADHHEVMRLMRAAQPQRFIRPERQARPLSPVG